MKQAVLFAFMLTVFVVFAHSQQIVQVRAEQAGDSVRIQYQLSDSVAGRAYRIDVYGISEKDTFRLEFATGDLGDRITAGNKTIIWEAYRQMGRFRGKVGIEVRAVPVFSVIRPSEPVTLKRGRPYTFRWYGGNSESDQLTIELYQFENKIDSLANVAGLSQYTWQVPAGIKPGLGYRLRIRGTSYTGIDTYTPDFTIQRRIPLVYSAGGTALGAIGVTAAIILLGPLPGAPGR
ncbi:MAG: hypothetical protein EAZ89_10195 [Bacteroidetes bacterium]|nr:MAG: hypothetical protein EAZ89_10195 [Bacteroidota bacterium]